AQADPRFAAVKATIQSRRSNLNVDAEREIPREVLDELLELAVTAPNHYRTQPWRFVVLTGPARERIGQIAADAYLKTPGATEAMAERQRTQFLRAPAIVVVASAPDEDPVKAFENRYSVAASVQNILLASTAAGLASYWRSGQAMINHDVSKAVKEAI